MEDAMAGVSQSQQFQKCLPISHQEGNDFKGVAEHPHPPAVYVGGEDAAFTQLTISSGAVWNSYSPSTLKVSIIPTS